MKVIFRKPQTGKTTELIKRCYESGGYIVCKNTSRAKFVMKMAREMNLKIPFPLTFDELLTQNYYARGVKSFHIDNADELIQMIATGVEVKTIVMDDLENL